MNCKEYVVYLDVFFLFSFIVNYMSIKLATIIIGNNPSEKRIYLGTIAFSIINILSLNLFFNYFVYWSIVNILSYLIITLIIYKNTCIWEYAKNCLILFVISIGFYGVINYLYYFTRLGNTTRNFLYGTSVVEVNERRFLRASVLAYILLGLALKITMKLRKNNNIFYEVKLTYNNKAVLAKALLDTGNSLVEPIFGMPVHIAEYELLKPIITKGDDNFREKLLAIPFHSLGEENGIIYGIRIDEMVIISEGRQLRLDKPVIGIYEGKLSGGGKYSVILNEKVNSIIKIESRGV